MNQEFKKSAQGTETRYVLENSATVTTGSVATAPSSLGKVQKRGNILAQEAGKEKEAPKPRNFVAKNAKMGGAGKMQDKSKTIPRKEKHKKPVAEGFNGEYDDEAGMAHSNLLTTARAVMGLLKTIKDRDNLPEWGQEKIAKAEMMLVSVWDYLQSQKQMGNDPQQDVAEGPNDGREDNFTIDDIKRLEKIRDFETLKAQAKELIKGKPARRMKPEKISWFYNHIDTLKNPLAVIKMMYDLMLAGEGNKVIGSRNSMSSNSYRTRFGEQGVTEGGVSMPGDQYLSIPADQTKLSIGQQMAQDGITYSPDKEDELIGLMSQYMKKAGMSSKQIRYLLNYDEDFIPDQLSDLPRQGVAEVAGPEKCWPGHRKVGTKPGTGKNAGKRVNDCEKIGEQGVAEGLGKTIKRGMAGWGAFDKDKPADVVKRVKGQDTDTLKGLSNRGSTGKGSPAELQQKAISRELKKRGEQGVAEGASDYVGDAIEALRVSKPGLGQEDFLDELYMYIENQYGQRAAEMMSNAGQDEFADWYDSYTDMAEAAPKGWEKTVKAMKKHDEIDNPYALANYMKNKGYKSHKEGADPYFESLADKLDQLKKK